MARLLHRTTEKPDTRNRDYDTAEAELQMIRTIDASPGVHMLVGAVEKKVRRRR